MLMFLTAIFLNLYREDSVKFFGNIQKEIIEHVRNLDICTTLKNFNVGSNDLL